MHWRGWLDALIRLTRVENSILIEQWLVLELKIWDNCRETKWNVLDLSFFVSSFNFFLKKKRKIYIFLIHFLIWIVSFYFCGENYFLCLVWVNLQRKQKIGNESRKLPFGVIFMINWRFFFLLVQCLDKRKFWIFF